VRIAPPSVVAALIGALAIASAGCGSPASAARRVRDNWLVVPLASGWRGAVVYGTSASQIIVAPFRLTAGTGRTEEAPPIPAHRYLITIFDYGRRPLGFPRASRLSLRPFHVSATNGAGTSKSFLRRSFLYEKISLTILVDFADRRPDPRQLSAVETVVRRIRVAPS
jgi:hypothetical protein